MNFKKILAAVAATALTVGVMATTAMAAEEFTVYAMIGADNAPDDWQYCYWGPECENVGDITAVTATITDNGTATVSATLATASGGKTWVTNPVILIDTAKYPNAVLEVIECKVDGVAVPVDYSVKDVKCWGEGTGIYSETECMRGAGYNEWGEKFIPACNGLTSIEYTVKLDLDGDGYASAGTDAAGGANTGVAPVAALAVATLAGAALVATKKR